MTTKVKNTMEIQQKKRVVVVGGGTGTHTLLRGLKKYSREISITAIVTMADSGGSTGRLRDEFGQLPVGDVRMALAALSADTGPHEELLRELFLYRFDKGVGLTGHNFGNLFLTALTEILGSQMAAIKTASRLLRVEGTVLPVTTDDVHLVATYDDGLEVIGEHAIDEPPASRAHNRIVDVRLEPVATIQPEVRAALIEADVIVFGPGDLYTSIIANLVVSGFREALVESQAKRLYISNLMSRPGQTKGMSASEYVAEMMRYTGGPLDGVIVNTTPFSAELLARYDAEGTHPVVDDLEESGPILYREGVVSGEVFTTSAGDTVKRSYIRHDSDKLAAVIMKCLHGEE